MDKARSSKLRQAYHTQKQQAKVRGIEWLFTFDTWLDVWDASGKLAERGPGRLQYCMARTNDAGPYSPENVRITTGEDNWREAAEVISARAAFRPHEDGKEHGEPSRTQLAVLAFIADHTKAKGFPPTDAEIAGFFGWRSANAAREHVQALVKKNLISKAAHSSRAIRLTDHAAQVLAEAA